MNRRLLATGLALLLGVLLGRYWPQPSREASLRATSQPAATSISTTRRPSATPTASVHASASGIAAPSPASLTADAATLWPLAQRQRYCTQWNRLGRIGATSLDPDSIDSDLEWIAILIDRAAVQWRAEPDDQKRVALLQRWSTQLTALCRPMGEADEDTLYRDARDAALLGPREARMGFLHNPPLPQLGAARRLDLWGDWVDTSAQLLNQMAAQGDPEALFIRGVALGFDNRPLQQGIDGMLGYLAPAIDNDPARAYRDLRACLASGDARWSAIAQALLPQIGARVDAAQRAAIDAEFAKH